MISSVTPALAGDCKTGQNTFLLEPTSEQTLTQNRAQRNFWVMDGYEASKAIRALNRADAVHIPIIAMTADAFEEDIRSCQEAGMVAHVTKPVDPQKLLKTLRDFIAKR